MSDPQTFWPAFFAFLAALVVGLPPILIALSKIRQQAKETHDLVNSRMTELLEITRTASKAEGVKEQKEKDV